MAKPKRKRIRQAKARRLHQEPIVRRVADILATGMPTQFRWASACRHGLRAAMCLKGKSWAAADERAALIVRLALVRIGAQYPTHRVAQGDPPAEARQYFYCISCRGHMPEGCDRPWCSEDCYRAHKESVRLSTRQREEEAKRRALRIIMLGPDALPVTVTAERHCRTCNKLFTPIKTKNRYCSRACSQKRERYPSQPCLVCAEPFKPHSHLQLTCGPACSKVATSRRQRANRGSAPLQLQKACAICEKPFAPSRLTAMHCSDECRHEAHLRQARAYAARKREAGLAEAA